MVEQRQLAERQRKLGNAAYKNGQYSEALRCYEGGLDAQRHNMALHANAAMAALKLRCFVQAQEHCDKVYWHGIRPGWVGITATLCLSRTGHACTGHLLRDILFLHTATAPAYR